MPDLTRRRMIAMGAVPVLAGLGAAATTGTPSRDARPRYRPLPPGSARARIQRAHLPNVPLVTQDGTPVRFYDDLVRDRKVALTFVSSRAPAESRTVTDNLAALRRFFGDRVGRDIFLYTIARTPAVDSPARLKAWSARAGAGPGWTFLTGEPSAVDALRRGLGFASTDAAEDTDPRYAVGQLRHGVEPEMRWGHCQSQASPRVLAHSMLLDFGAAPAGPVASFVFKDSAAPAPIWNCRRLLAGIA